MENMDFVSRDAERITALLDKLLTPGAGISHARLYEAMRYSALAGGKRVRPHLVYEFCRACGGNEICADAYAAAIELIHTYSLIHDDLPSMDNDVMRRGKPSNHVAFGEATAILAGDALQTEAFSIVANNEHCTDEQNAFALVALAEAAGVDGMVGGQQIDIEISGNGATQDKVFDMYMRKTGALITCACMLGCIAANADRNLMNAAGEFGSCIGIAFQIIDDLLDIESTSEEMGKTVGKDTAVGKSTLVALIGVDEARRTAQQLTSRAAECLDKFEANDAVMRLKSFCRELCDRKK